MEKLIIVTEALCISPKDNDRILKASQSEIVSTLFNPEWQKEHSTTIIREYPAPILESLETLEELFDFLYLDMVGKITEVREIPNCLKSLKPLSKELAEECMQRELGENIKIEEALKLYTSYSHNRRNQEEFEKMTDEEKAQYYKALEDSRKNS